MSNSGQIENGNGDFYNRYQKYSDEQLKEILHHHKDYRDDAVSAATRLAIERQIIHSEQDLLAPEYQATRQKQMALFPEPVDKYHKNRLISSIFRFFYVLSLLPVIYGFLQYGKGQITQSLLGVGVGVIWFFFCVIFSQRRKQYFLAPLFILLLVADIYTGYLVFTSLNHQVLDFVMLTIGILLPVYLLLYLKKLIANIR